MELPAGPIATPGGAQHDGPQVRRGADRVCGPRYLEGSGWKEYQQNQVVCGIKLPAGLIQGAELAEPIFTPATKEESGHDINISFERMVEIVGLDTAGSCAIGGRIYRRGASARGTRNHHRRHEVRVGPVGGQLILIDEVLTPDSSRFLAGRRVRAGEGQPSFDKQFVRDWLSSTGWDKNSPPPALPDDVVAKTRDKYIDAYERLTAALFAWK